MLRFARFLPASSDTFQKVPFGNCVVRFCILSTNARACSNKLTDDPTGYRSLWNSLRKIDDCFAKPGRSFFQIVNPFYLWFFADKSRASIPKRILKERISAFRFRHSFVIRHSCLSFLSLRAVQFLIEPRLGKFPIAPHRDRRNLQHFCYLVIVQPAEILHLHHFGFSRVERAQLTECFV